MHEKLFYVYILTNKAFGVFYIGVTSNLERRIYEHRNKLIPGFTSRYNLTRLVYYEVIETAEAAITREKTLKRWPREWKINIINQFNPDWNDLYETLAA
jgi:putative endonuclease